MKAVDLTKTKLRFIVLVLASLTCFGSYFVYDNPAALQTQLQDSLNINDFEFNLFYSIYSFPNIILPILGGYFVDMIGPRIGTFTFALLIAIGQCIFALGVMLGSYPIALTGRGVFGVGGECLNLSINYFITKWFKGKELSMAIGTSLSVGRIGSITNDNIEPVIVIKSGSLSLGLWIGFLICILSLVCAGVLNLIDQSNDRKLGVTEKFHLPAEEKFKFSDIKSFSFCFWCVCLNSFVVLTVISSFMNIASNYFQERFGYTTIEAGSIMSITYIIAVFLCPLFGIVVDRIGKRAHFLTFSAIAVTLVNVAFILTPETHRPVYPIFFMAVLGVGYSIYVTVFWASISLLVEAKANGTGLGIASAIQNTGSTIGPIVVGLIQENTNKDKGYYWVTFFFVMMGIVGVVSAIFICIHDNRYGGVLRSKASHFFMNSSSLDEENQRLTLTESIS